MNKNAPGKSAALILTVITIITLRPWMSMADRTFVIETQTEDINLPNASEPQDDNIELFANVVSEITVSPPNLALKIGDTQTLVTTVSPSKPIDTVVWSSYNKSDATVDHSRNVTAIVGESAI